jgi:tripartite-type tricarboxylate transporter receptor subunit TctC
VVDKLHGALKQIEAQPKIKQQISRVGMIPLATPSVAEMTTYIQSEIKRWGAVVKKSGAVIE